MTIKMKYNYLAAILGVVVVLVFTLAELVYPGTVTTNKNVTGEINLPVIMYHHVLKNTSKLGDYTISPDAFESDLKYINDQGYNSITTKDLTDYLEFDIPLPEKPIMITFDDSFESIYAYCFPLIQQYNVKVVVNVLGSHTDLFSDENEPKNLNYSHLNWNQLRDMNNSGLIEIGNHSYDLHYNNSNGRNGIKKLYGESIDDYRIKLIDDIGGLNRKIESELGVKPEVFAFPFGAYSKESYPILQEIGFKVILGCEEKNNIITKDMTLPITLKRFNRASKYSTKSFFQKIEQT